MKQTPSRYTKTAIILHWLIAIFIALMFVLGWYMAELPKEAPKQMAYDLFDLGVYTWQLAEEASPRTGSLKFLQSHREKSRHGYSPLPLFAHVSRASDRFNYGNKQQIRCEMVWHRCDCRP